MREFHTLSQLRMSNQKLIDLEGRASGTDNEALRAMFSYLGGAAREEMGGLPANPRLGDCEAHRFSVAVLCGAILQIAKQGISVTHSGKGCKMPNECLEGRLIKSISIRDIVWHGRNQAIHYEQKDIYTDPRSEKIRLLFNSIDTELDMGLSHRLHENLASEVVNILGWHSYPAYEKDMNELLL